MEVIKIEPKKQDDNSQTGMSNAPKRRVAAYARVSTELDEQQSSYEAQINYYTNYIKSNPNWEFVDIYSDEGISGTNTKHRKGFNRMIADALDGEIDLILTKSISRFARNTVDSLTTIRKLREHNVEVYFEKENINTMDSKGEIMLTIMSSLAQEESRSISENVTWASRKRMENGVVHIPHSLAGYKVIDGEIVIVEDEANIIRRIFQRYLDGDSAKKIADDLNADGIKTPRKQKAWSRNTIDNIIVNEKYKGDALLQKTYTVSYITKEIRKNVGSVPQYYVQNSHPAIIDPVIFDQVQAERKRRLDNRIRRKANSAFGGKIYCGDCGYVFGPRSIYAHQPENLPRTWSCTHKYRAEQACKTPNIRGDKLEKAFVMAFNEILENKDRFIQNIDKTISKLQNAEELKSEFERAQEEFHLAESKYQELVDKFSHGNPDITKSAIDEAETDCKLKFNTFISLKDSFSQPYIIMGNLTRMRDILSTTDTLMAFNDELCQKTLSKGLVSHEGYITFTFCDGTEIKVSLEDL